MILETIILGGLFLVVTYWDEIVNWLKDLVVELREALKDLAHAIDVLLQHIGGKIEDTIAFGDAKIDIPMFEYCHMGVAMGNGGEEIKAIADFVTDAVAEDGLAHAFQRLDLI